MPRDDLTGRTIAGYTLQTLVGEGGTSTVYRAKHTTHGVVAVKILRSKLRSDKTAVARFLREADYGQRIVHPNIIRTIESGEAEPGLHYLVTEWAEGQLLDDFVRSQGHLSLEVTERIVAQLAEAVQAVHLAGIVHRDLKPENVMYDPHSQVLKLLDFGIATEADMTTSDRLTRAGFFVGSLMYVAPEALSGEIVTAAADQYSLATIAYFLLTGTHPYRTKTPREMFAQLLSQPPIPLVQARKDLTFPAELNTVVSRALSREPKNRFPDIVAFSAAFRAAAAPGSVGADQETLMGRIRGLLRWEDETPPTG